MKTEFSRPVATAEFYNFAGILSAAEYEIAQLELNHLHQLCS